MLTSLIMRLRGSPVGRLKKIQKQASRLDLDLSLLAIESQHLAGGNPALMVDALAFAKKHSITYRKTPKTFVGFSLEELHYSMAVQIATMINKSETLADLKANVARHEAAVQEKFSDVGIELQSVVLDYSQTG